MSMSFSAFCKQGHSCLRMAMSGCVHCSGVPRPNAMYIDELTVPANPSFSTPYTNYSQTDKLVDQWCLASAKHRTFSEIVFLLILLLRFHSSPSVTAVVFRCELFRAWELESAYSSTPPPVFCSLFSPCVHQH